MRDRDGGCVSARAATRFVTDLMIKGVPVTSSTAERARTETGEREGEEGALHPLLLAALMARREERGDTLFEHPLLLAALARRRRDDDEPGIEHPLLLMALAGRKRRGKNIVENPLLLAALMARN